MLYYINYRFICSDSYLVLAKPAQVYRTDGKMPYLYVEGLTEDEKQLIIPKCYNGDPQYNNPSNLLRKFILLN